MAQWEEWLRDRWKGHEKELEELIPIIRSDSKWYDSESYKTLIHVLGTPPEGLESVERDLRGAPLSGSYLREAKLDNVDFSWANLSEADLIDVSLSHSRLRFTNFSEALLWRADLSKAYFLASDLSGTSFWGANFSEAWLEGVALTRATLQDANLAGAHITHSSLSEADLTRTKYITDEVFNRLISWWIPSVVCRIPFLKDSKYFRTLRPIDVTDFEGVDTSKIDGSKNPVLKRHIEDYQFIQAFKGKSFFHRRIFYLIWKITSDCGRSTLLWLFWSVGFVVLFTTIYSWHLDWFKNVGQPRLNWFNVLYFSITTFTTLGFGDLTPRLDSVAAQAWVMAEVIIGYIMLGGLISILANKLARRA